MKRRAFVHACAAGLAAFASLPTIQESYLKRLRQFRNRIESVNGDDVAFWKAVRDEFKLDSEIVHLNCGTIGASPQIVIDALKELVAEIESNPYDHVFGEGLNQQLEAVRATAAKLIGAATAEVAIIRNTTEGMNLIARGIKFRPGDEILTSNHEHPGGVIGWQYIARRYGLKVVCVPLPVPSTSGDAIVRQLKRFVTPRTRVFSFCHVDTITGTVLPIEDIAALARENRSIMVCDGAQAIGMLDLDVKKLGVHAYVASGHKWLLGPKGSGVIYLDHSFQSEIDALELTAGFKVYSASSGTRDVAGILSLGIAMQFMGAIGMARVARRTRRLSNYLIERLRSLTALTLLTESPHEGSSGIVTAAIDPRLGTSSGIAKRLREEFKIYVKAAQANWNLNDESAARTDYNAIRISSHIFNSERQIDRAVDALAELLDQR